jgi:hypothetical protein
VDSHRSLHLLVLGCACVDTLHFALCVCVVVTYCSKDHVFHLVNNRDAYWFSLPAHILLPQRTTQFAYSIDLVILMCALSALRRRVAKVKSDDDAPSSNGDVSDGGVGEMTPQQQRSLLLFAAFCTALLPFVHVRGAATMRCVLQTCVCVRARVCCVLCAPFLSLSSCLFTPRRPRKHRHCYRHCAAAMTAVRCSLTPLSPWERCCSSSPSATLCTRLRLRRHTRAALSSLTSWSAGCCTE